MMPGSGIPPSSISSVLGCRLTVDLAADQLLAHEMLERHPDVDPYRVGFPQLRNLVTTLPGFKEEPGHPSNEKILEAIQQAWIDEVA